MAEPAGDEPAIAERLAAFAHDFRLEDAPPSLIDKAKLHILDTLGCAIAGAATGYAERSFKALARLDGGTGSVAIGRAETLGLADAIRFNAGIAHMLDFDDTHTTTLNHVSASAAPLVLALGAHRNASGADMLVAYLVAAEASCRAGLGADGPAFLHRGVHPTGALCVFGSALGAGRLLGLDTAQMTHAQGIALSFAAGSMEWQRDGAEAKRLHPGNAAASGLLAASSAGAGITGPRLPYEGRFGIYRLFLGADAAVDAEAICAGLSARWAFDDVSIKPFPLVHHVHGVIDCALRLVQEDGIGGDDIDRLTVHIAAAQAPILAEPVAAKRNPFNEYQAIASVYHTVATAIARGAMTLAETDAALIDDPVIAALRQRIEYRVNPDSLYPRYYSGGVTAMLKDGRTLERFEKYHPGSDRRPATRDAVIGKFRANAARVFASARIEEIELAVLALERTAPATLMALLAR